MNRIKLFILTAMLILSLNNFAYAKGFSNNQCFNVAVVDIQRVVASSPQINALKTDRTNKLNDLAKFIENARQEVAKEKDDAKKKALEDKYNKELNLRKDTIDKEYTKKLSEIDKDITAVIKTEAKKSGYDLVLTKTSVLDGGCDITDEIIKRLK